MQVNLQSNDGNTPLHAAAEEDRLEVVKYLLQNPDILVNEENNYGESAIDLAKKNGDLACVNILESRVV